MQFFSPLLLSISSNLDTFRISNFYGAKKICINKVQIMLISIITTIATFFSMYLGTLIKNLFLSEITTLFGSVLLIFIGIYFFVEYIRLKKKSLGEDTSYYVENISKYNMFLEEGKLSIFNNSVDIHFKDYIFISLALSKINVQLGIIASIIGVNIPLSIFFNFIITIVSLCLGEYVGKSCFSKLVTKYSYLVCGCIIIILGVYEMFI
ncbi:manganese efflux pump [Clostridium uliginosum]|uniref:Putative sporulation protein YtaF n=1 Tax=Clostridium uliginosum TaxID=119641 RepID=A0A1I1S3F7_9CLOT|nr:manganese efflux pump [Clostridium uliginosum]SFD40882.1 putative sporulation protein YtaF [Clostridium uliginosum]